MSMMKWDVDFCRVRSTELDKNRQLEIMSSEAIQHFIIDTTIVLFFKNESTPKSLFWEKLSHLRAL